MNQQNKIQSINVQVERNSNYIEEMDIENRPTKIHSAYFGEKEVKNKIMKIK